MRDCFKYHWDTQNEEFKTDLDKLLKQYELNPNKWQTETIRVEM